MGISPQLFSLITKLADGEYHSGEELGAEIGVSRSAIWKSLKPLSDIGLEISRVPGRGYCLDGGLSLLDAAKIQATMPDTVATALHALEILPVVGSTNKHLLDKIAKQGELPSGCVCLAEMQTAGRGRRGREWQSPFGRNLYLSLNWQFHTGAQALEGLSLAVGVAVTRAISKQTGVNASLKWPNDILLNDAKLGGILIEISGDISGQCQAVIGVGLNVDVPDTLMADVDQRWTDLRQACESLPARSALAGSLIIELVQLLSDYETRGFAGYRDEWEKKNAFLGRESCLYTPKQSISGVVLGVSDSGALRLSVDGVEQVYSGGELSLRMIK